MTKKILIICLVVLATFGCFKKEETLTDAMKFKQEYESVNGKENSSGKTIRTINIDAENPIVYATAGDIVKMIDNEESFVVYFGFSTCPWCRSMVETLIKTAKDLNINKIYYVDVLDIRDVKAVDTNDKDIITTKEGSEDYMKLIQRLGNVLEDYTLTNSKNKQVSAGEKRIYAPNVVTIIKGSAKKLTSGISELETDSYMPLTDEMLTDSYNQIKEVLDVYKEDSACGATSAC